MLPNYDVLEQLAQAHRRDLLREAERERLLAHLPQPDHHVPCASWQDRHSSCESFA